MKAYTIAELVQQRDDITSKVLHQLSLDSNLLKVLGDNMAESATNIQGHGYGSFLNARETFLSELSRIQEEYSSFICSEYKKKSD